MVELAEEMGVWACGAWPQIQRLRAINSFMISLLPA